jgi:hypothetical protein
MMSGIGKRYRGRIHEIRRSEVEAVNDPTTSADDAQVAGERSAAEELMGRAIAESGEARAQATNALAAGATGQAQPVASVRAGIDREIGEMRDTVQEERLHVLKGQDEMPKSEQRPQKAQRRARGRSFDAGL